VPGDAGTYVTDFAGGRTAKRAAATKCSVRAGKKRCARAAAKPR
jgi:hypothetical protein